MMEARREIYTPAEPSNIIKGLLTPDAIGDIESVLPGLSELSKDKKDASSIARLKSVVNHLENTYRSNATILDSSLLKGPPKLDYKEAMNAAMTRLRKGLCEVLSGSVDSSGSKEEVNVSLEESPKYVPGPNSHEIDRSQRWLQAVLESIGACWEPAASMTKSPAKNSVIKEAHVPKTNRREKRLVDFVLRKEGRWEAIIFDDILTLPVEVKAACRSDQDPDHLWMEGTKQVLSHLAKFLFVGFNFAGYGVPCHGTGVVLSMGTIQVLHLRYENVGQPDAVLRLYQSTRMPLMTKPNFEAWVKDATKYEEKFTNLITEMYGPDDKNRGMGEDEVPSGVRVLFNLMNRRGSDLYGLSVEVKAYANGDEVLDGPPLGSGATSVVFRKSGNESHVIKLSRYGIKTGIENEVAILKILKKRSLSAHPNLPRLVESTIIED